MAGHSKWNNIKRTKGVIDIKRGAQFTKIAREISTIVSVSKNGDVNTNPLLKATIDRAKAINMTKEKIEKAVNRGLGIRAEGSVLLLNTYEFYGPSGSVFLVECETDNQNRTMLELKIVSNKYNLKLASEGSISWQFKEFGELEIQKENDSETQEIKIMEIDGVLDILEEEDSFIIYSKKEDLKKIRDLAEEKNLKINSFSIIKKTDDLINIENLEEVSSIENEFFANQDVVNVWKNYNEN